MKVEIKYYKKDTKDLHSQGGYESESSDSSGIVDELKQMVDVSKVAPGYKGSFSELSNYYATIHIPDLKLSGLVFFG